MSQKLPEDVRSILQGPLHEVGRPIMYVPALVVVAALMLLLPLCYLGLVVALGFGVYWHASTNHVWLTSGEVGRMSILILLGYLTPIVAGSVAVFFMIKPFFAPRAEKPDFLSLEESDQPRLFAYIRELCQEIGAPVPRRIDVDCDVNASAGPSKGLFSLVRRDLVLTIGLPLVMGLDVRQLSGVIAHEFGHFTQGAGLIASYVVNSINRWFARVVYERDAWDTWLDEAQSHSGWIVISLVIALIRLCVGLTRIILWVFMIIGHALSCFLARQMEYDADRIQAHVSGCESFKTTARRIITLDAAFHASHRELNERFGEGRLPDNLPLLIAANVKRFQKEIAEMVSKEMEGGSGTLFDTHPPMSKRIANAERENTGGIVSVDAPAAALFNDIDDVCERATWENYKAILGEQFYETELIPTRKLLADHSEGDKAGEAVREFLPPPLAESPAFWLNTHGLSRPEDAKALMNDLKRARDQYRTRRDQAVAAAEAFFEARRAHIKAGEAVTLVRAGLRPDASEYSLDKPTKEHADAARHFAEEKTERARAAREPFDELSRTRLLAALGLLYVKQIGERVGDAKRLRADANTMLHVLGALQGARDSGRAMSDSVAALTALLKATQTGRINEKMHNEAMRLTRRITKAMGEIRGATLTLDYPFDHAKERVTVADFVCPVVPNPDDVGAVFESATEMAARLGSIYTRALGRLAATAQRVEQALDLKPIGVPEPATTRSAGQPSGTSRPPRD